MTDPAPSGPVVTWSAEGPGTATRGFAILRGGVADAAATAAEAERLGEAQARREAAAQIAFYAAPRTYGTVVDVAGFSQGGSGSGRRSRRATSTRWRRPCPTR
jgi:hypothetical protein